jgi:hypothetical protein
MKPDTIFTLALNVLKFRNLNFETDSRIPNFIELGIKYCLNEN